MVALLLIMPGCGEVCAYMDGILLFLSGSCLKTEVFKSINVDEMEWEEEPNAKVGRSLFKKEWRFSYP
jgi:hypothetical protein